MRIAHVVVTDAFAGTERYVVDVGAALAARGHEVVVVGGERDAMTSRLPAGVRWLPGAGAGSAFASLRRSGRHDVVHTHTAKADFVALGAAPWTGGARIATRHITAPRGFGRTARALAPLVARALTHEVAVSSFVAGAVESVPDVVLLNGVTPVAAPAAPLAGPRASSRRVAAVAAGAGGGTPGGQRGADAAEHGGGVVLVAQRLAAEKDTATAVRAFARSGLAEQGWRLVLAGQGDQAPALAALAARLGLDGAVETPGWLGDMGEAYARASVLLAPAPAEPCGLTVLEAMARGLPVVAAAGGGHLETVGRARGAALFAPGDDAGAADHLRRLALDARRRSAYGEELRELQQAEFTIERHVDVLESVYTTPRGCWPL